MKSSSRVNFGLFTALALATILVPGSFGQTGRVTDSQSQKKLDQHSVSRLITAAKSPEDHQRIAQYYEEQALHYENLSRAYGAKIRAYEKSPYLSSCTMCVTTSSSLEAAVQSLRISKLEAEQRADEMRKLANMHEQLSSVALSPGPSSGL